MIATGPHCSENHKEAHVQGWLISILLHGTVALAAILFVKQVQLVPQDEAFKWNVAMVSPTQHVPSTTSVPPPPTQQTMPAQTFSPPQPLAQQTTPSFPERTGASVGTESPAPPPTQQAEPVRHEVAVPMAAESTSIVKPAEAPMAVSAEPDTQTAQSVQAPAQMATISPAPSSAPTKRDYGWLSDEILRRVEELKRYPASARIDRAEGKVVVKAVIHEDGNIGEVEIFQSSGYLTLDKAAVETMRQAAPFHLPHPLGQPRMTIKIPMSYRLDR